MRRAGSVSIRSTKLQGMVRGGILLSRRWRAARGARPRRRRRMAPRTPMSTEWMRRIAFEKKEAFSAVGGGPVRGLGGGVNVGVDGGDGGEGKDAVAGFCFDDKGGDAVAVFLRSESDFAHASRSRAGGVIDRCAEKLGKRQRRHPG